MSHRWKVGDGGEGRDAGEGGDAGDVVRLRGNRAFAERLSTTRYRERREVEIHQPGDEGEIINFPFPFPLSLSPFPFPLFPVPVICKP
ncbi:MAG TPA: hypothetical protein V6D25_07060 [Leptolyngbyaceae cyanobacterium]